MNVTACPACGSTTGRDTGDEAPSFSERVGDTEFVQPPYGVRECSTCGLLYKTRTLTQAQFNDYYSKADFRKWEIEDFYPTEAVLLKELGSLPPGSMILDYGCSSGRLLATLVRSHRCFGYEINQAAGASARAKGLHMLSASALGGTSTMRFDAIVLADIFEHLDAPTALLADLIRLLRPGGVLMIATGNGDDPACRLDPAQFWYFRSVEHLLMLTRRHVDWLCSRFTVRLTSWQLVCHYELNLIQKIRQYCQHVAYWKFQSGNMFVRGMLSLIPYFQRARQWRVAPAFTSNNDHLVLVFEKHRDAGS
jgi:SAM-dependent methyltransferase